MTDREPRHRPFAVAVRYLALLAGCVGLLLAATCFAVACQVFIQTGLFAQSYAIVGLIAGTLGLLSLRLGRIWR